MTDADLAAFEAALAANIAEHHASCWCGDDEASQTCDARAEYARVVPVLVAEVRRLWALLDEHAIALCGCSTRVDYRGKRVECCEVCA